jgi:hypothetical protein
MTMTQFTNFEIVKQFAMLLFICPEDELDKFCPVGQIALCNIITAIQNELSKLFTFDDIDCLTP